jgi:hypothetical protein
LSFLKAIPEVPATVASNILEPSLAAAAPGNRIAPGREDLAAGSLGILKNYGKRYHSH